MSEFSANLTLRIRAADDESTAASEAGDDFGAAVFAAMAEDLRRVACAHDLVLPPGGAPTPGGGAPRHS